MSKRAILACLLAVMMLLTGCSLVVKDQAVDNAAEIVRVGDVVHTKAEVKSLVQSYLANMQNYYYQYYGYNIDVTDSAVIADAQDYVIETLIQEDVIAAKRAAMGCDELTEDELAAIDAEWTSNTQLIRDLFFADTELEGEALETAVESYALQLLGTTKEGMITQAKNNKLRDQVVADVAVTDDEVKADYDAKVEAAKTSYDANLSAYGQAVNKGEAVYYRPAGYRMVKSILLQADTAASTALTTKATAQKNMADAKKTEIAAKDAEADLEALAAQVNVQVEIPAEVTAGTELTAVVSDTLPDIDAELAQLVREYQTAVALNAAYEAQADLAKKAAFAAAEEKADAVLAELAAGADFDETMKAKTEDPGMQSGATAENGYAICEGYTSFVASYVEGAMALANVGDVSGKVLDDSYGYFIIKYVSDVAEGAVDLADVQEGIKGALLATKQDQAYQDTVSKWVSEANAKINKKPLAD